MVEIDLVALLVAVADVDGCTFGFAGCEGHDAGHVDEELKCLVCFGVVAVVDLLPWTYLRRNALLEFLVYDLSGLSGSRLAQIDVALSSLQSLESELAASRRTRGHAGLELLVVRGEDVYCADIFDVLVQRD